MMFSLVRMLMSAIALRRMKTTLVDGKPMVDLPSKTIQIEHVKLSDDERKTYEAMQNEGRLIVTRLVKLGRCKNIVLDRKDEKRSQIFN